MSSLSSFPSLLPLGIVASCIDTEHLSAVTAFCEECSAFFALVVGESPAVETARHLLESRPPGVAVNNKYVVVFKRQHAIIAVADLLKGYPQKAEWYIGLLLVAPSERGHGLGTALWNAVEDWICADGGRHVRLIVQQQNPDAARFWRAMGFTADGMVEQRLTTRTNSCWRFEKQLTRGLGKTFVS